MITRNISLSRQVAQDLLSGIQTGTLPRENGMLPSEAELCQRYAVSRATVREALSQLEQRGIVLRRHGVGTFVAPQPPPIEAGLEELESIETLARRMGLETRMGDPFVEERAATPAEAQALQVEANTPVLATARVIMTGERPIAYLVDVVPTAILQRADLDDHFRGSILDLFIRRGDLSLSHSRTDILIEPASETIAAKLHIQPGEPLHKLLAQLYTRDGRVIDYSTTFLVPGYFRFHVIRRVAASNGDGKYQVGILDIHQGGSSHA